MNGKKLEAASSLFKYFICFVLHMKDKPDEYFIATLCGKARMQILKSIRYKTRNVTELSKELGINQSTLSHNLKQLEKYGFVAAEKRKKYRYYSLNGKHIATILELIDKHVEECCHKTR